jgi:hypothetical protein
MFGVAANTAATLLQSLYNYNHSLVRAENLKTGCKNNDFDDSAADLRCSNMNNCCVDTGRFSRMRFPKWLKTNYL